MKKNFKCKKCDKKFFFYESAYIHNLFAHKQLCKFKYLFQFSVLGRIVKYIGWGISWVFLGICLPFIILSEIFGAIVYFWRDY